MKWVIITTVMPRSCSSRTTRMSPARPAGVEHGRGLVQNEDGRIHGEHPGDGHALLLTARERIGLVGLEALQAHFGERPGHALAQLGVGMPRFSGPKATSFSMRLATSWSSGFWKTSPALERMK